jgi:transposase-like protein
MVRSGRELLHEKVEVDETYVGGSQPGLRGGRERGEKALVVVAVEVRGTASGRVRLRVIPDAAGPTLTGFVKAHVEPGAIVVTDAWQGYAPLSGMGYRHRPHTQGGDPKRVERFLPRVHRVFENLKTWLRGTHHGVDEKHLQVYLDEWAIHLSASGPIPCGPGPTRAPQGAHMLGPVQSSGYPFWTNSRFASEAYSVSSSWGHRLWLNHMDVVAGRRRALLETPLGACWRGCALFSAATLPGRPGT